MADSEHKAAEEEKAKYPAFLGRLNMRFGKGSDYKLPHGTQATKDDAALTTILKNKGTYIRSKYKGQRAASGAAEAEGDDEELGLPGKAAASEATATGKTSGIPIFGESDAEARVGWSLGHSKVARETTAELQEAARTTRLSAENSHALGHADYGTDHELSAPSASKAQNTEQLAIELAMRKGAKDLNAAAGLTDGTSLVHMKITDALDPKSGQLRARRLKLIRRANAADKDGTVVFDHLMDGDRLHISKDEAYDVGKRAHAALIAGKAVPRATARHGDGKGSGDRKGMDPAIAPTRDDLHDHQKKVLSDLKTNQKAAEATGLHRFKNEIDDRKGVKMVGPAFTEVAFPGAAAPIEGQKALTTVRDHVATTHSKSAEEAAAWKKNFETSGSLPADADSKMQKRMNVLMDSFGDRLAGGTEDIDAGEDDPVDFKKGSDHGHRVAMEKAVRDSGMTHHEQQLLALQFASVKKSGNHSRLSADEKKLLLGIHSISEGLPEHEVLTKSKREAKAKQLFKASSFLADSSDDEAEHKSNSSDDEDDSADDGKAAAMLLSSSHPLAQKPAPLFSEQHSIASMAAAPGLGDDDFEEEDMKPPAASSLFSSLPTGGGHQPPLAATLGDEEDDFADEEGFDGDFSGDEEDDDELPQFKPARVAQKMKMSQRPDLAAAGARQVKKKRREPSSAIPKPGGDKGPKGAGPPKGGPPKY